MRLRYVILLLAASTLVFSQETKSKDHKPAEKKSMPAAEQQGMPKPSEEAQRLSKAFGGNWTVSGKTEESPAGPAETANGTERCHDGPGHFSVICDANMKFSRMGPFTGHGVMYWDAENKTYTGLWCDSMGPCAPQGTGTWEGEKLVLNGEMKMNGQTSKMRQTYSDITPNSYTFLMEMGDQSGEMKPWMTLQYKRASAAPAKK